MPVAPFGTQCGTLCYHTRHDVSGPEKERTYMATITPTAPTATTDAPAPTRPLTAQDLFALRFVGEVQLSPDGTQVAYTVTQADGEVNRNRSAIWLAPADGGTPPAS